MLAVGAKNSAISKELTSGNAPSCAAWLWQHGRMEVKAALSWHNGSSRCRVIPMPELTAIEL